MLYKLVQNIDKERNCFFSSYEVSIHSNKENTNFKPNALKELTQNSYKDKLAYLEYF